MNQIQYKDLTDIFLKCRGSTPLTYNNSSSRSNDTAYLINHQKMEENSILDSYFQRVRDIKNELRSAQSIFGELLKSQQDLLRPTFENTDQLQSINEKNMKITRCLQNVQMILNTFLDFQKNRYPAEVLQIINNLHTTLNERYRSFNYDYKMAQQTFSASYSRTQQENQNTSQSVADYQFTINDEIKNPYQLEMEQRKSNEEMEAIYKRAEEVKQLFSDLSTIITEQGTIIDRIDVRLTQSLTNAQAAHDEVVKASRHQKKSRMWKCAAILGVIVFFMLLMTLLSE